MSTSTRSELLEAAQRARTAYEWEEAIACYDIVLALPGLTREEELALRDSRAFCNERLANFRPARDDLAAAARLAADAGDEPRALDALARQAVVHNLLGEIQASRQLAQQILERARMADLPYFEARAQYIMALTYTTSGEYEAAAEAAARALQRFVSQGALRDEALASYLIAYCASYTGQEAEHYGRRVAEIARQLDDRLLQGRAHHILGVIYQDQPTLARSHHEKALAIYEAVREKQSITAATHNLGTFYYNYGLFKRAHAYFQRAAYSHAAVEASGNRLLSLHLTAAAAFLAGYHEEGLALNRRVISEAQAAGAQNVEAFALMVRGGLLVMSEQPTLARQFLLPATEKVQVAPTWMPTALGWLGMALLGSGDVQGALQKTSEALQWAAELPHPAYLEVPLWFRYRALQAAADNPARASDEAWELLQRSFALVLSRIENLHDQGLRRSYLSRAFIIPEIVLGWARQAHARGLSLEPLQPPTPEASSVEEPFRRLLAFATRLTTERDAQEIPAFILDEFVELSGAERAFLALRPEDDFSLPSIVRAAGIGGDEAEAVYAEARPYIDEALLARHPIFAEHIGEVPAGEAPPIHQRSLLVVPLVTPTRAMGVLYADIRELFGPFSHEDGDLLSLLANYAAAALENARWTQTLEQRVEERTEQLEAANQQLAQQNAELTVINSVQQGLVAHLDMQAIYDLVGDQIGDIFDACTVGIGTFSGDPLQQHVRYLYEDGQRYPAQTLPLGRLGQEMVTRRRSFLLNTQADFQALGLEIIEGTAPALSAVFVPLLRRGEVWGGITIQNVEREYAFDEEDVRLLETLANSMSLALQNAELLAETKRLLKETEERNAELAIINNVQAGLVAQVDIQAIYDLVGEETRRLFDAQVVTINRIDWERRLNEYWFVFEKGERLPLSVHPISPLVDSFLRLGQTLLVNEGAPELLAQYQHTIPYGETPRSFVAVPLRSGETLTGYISLQNLDRERAFSDADVRLLETLANSLSISLENARLFDEAQRHAREMSALTEVGRDISATLDLPTVLTRIASHARELLQASDSAVFLPDEQHETLHAFVAQGPIAEQVKATVVRPGRGIVGDLWQRRQAQVINDTSRDPRAVTIAGTVTQPGDKLMVAPLLSGDEVTGMMTVWRSAGTDFDEADLRFLEGLARQASVAIENARLYAEAEAARTVAEEANESKSAFLANVSHELRTPLTSILGFARIVQKRLEERVFPHLPQDDARARRSQDQIADNLQIILAEGERLTTLINNVLDLEKIEAGRMEWRMEPLALAEVVEQALHATSSIVEQAGLTLVEEIPADLPPINGDHDKLVQVMINLISNAVKFTDTGAITCRLRQDEGQLLVSIADTGVGIAPEYLDTVFEKFRQVGDPLTDKPTGTGLGLSICKEIVERHGGRIWVESTVGHGSIFTLALPIPGAEAAGGVRRLSMDALLAQLKQRIAQVPGERNNGGYTILVADDDANIRKLLRQELTAEGYEVHEAADGRQALAQVKALRPDLVVLDLLMPELNGFDVAAVLKNDPQTMGLPIVIISVLEDQQRGYRLGVDRYLTKPLELSALLQEVQNLLAQGTSRRRVLVVDEDAGTVETLTQALQAQGYEVSGVTAGREAIAAAAAARPDMIIVDALLSEQLDLVQAIRFEKGLENVLFLLVQ